jgi:hypothetical protein
VLVVADLEVRIVTEDGELRAGPRAEPQLPAAVGVMSRCLATSSPMSRHIITV